MCPTQGAHVRVKFEQINMGAAEEYSPIMDMDAFCNIPTANHYCYVHTLHVFLCHRPAIGASC